jgi:hypothetical protein
MHKNRWDVERAAAWLRRHAWGESGEAAAPPLEQDAIGAAAIVDPAPIAAATDGAAGGSPSDEQDELDIAGWPALVAPFYD